MASRRGFIGTSVLTATVGLAGCTDNGDDDSDDEEADPVEAAVDIGNENTAEVWIDVTSANNADQIVLVQDGIVKGTMEASTGASETFTGWEPGSSQYEVWAILGEDIREGDSLNDADGSLQLDVIGIIGAIEPGTTIVMAGETTWEGVEPSGIEGEQNPTLVLEAGREYELTWEQGDGRAHNIEIRDDVGDPVNGLASEITDSPGGDDSLPLTFEATEEMATYRCLPHPSMEGETIVD